MRGFVGIDRLERQHLWREVFKLDASFYQPRGKGHDDRIKVIEVLLDLLGLAVFPVVVDACFLVRQFLKFCNGGVREQTVVPFPAVFVEGLSGFVGFHEQQAFVQRREPDVAGSVETQPHRVKNGFVVQVG